MIYKPFSSICMRLESEKKFDFWYNYQRCFI